MTDGNLLEKYLNAPALDMLDGRAPAEVSKLAGAFRTDRLLVLRGWLSAEGLSAIRAHLDALGRDFDTQRVPDGGREAAVAAMNRHVMQEAFVRALSDDPRFSGFLSRVTGRPGIRIRKAGAAVYAKGGSETPPWHFDGPRISLVIPIDAPPPEAGGAFAYFPMARRREDASWVRSVRGAMLRLGLHRVFRSPRVIPYEAGSVLLFDGDTTYHRALGLKKDALRRSLLFFFDDRDSAGVADMMM